MLCPITHEMMVDPVVCADGHSYERSWITQWLSMNDTSPKTNAQLEHTNLTSNHTLRGSIEQFSEMQKKTKRGRNLRAEACGLCPQCCSTWDRQRERCPTCGFTKV